MSCCCGPIVDFLQSQHKKEHQLKASAVDATISFVPGQEGAAESTAEESSETDIRPQCETLPDGHATVGGFDSRDRNGLLMQVCFFHMCLLSLINPDH